MKKLIFLLLISGGLSAQVVIPKSTTTFSNISATGNLTVNGTARVTGATTLTGAATLSSSTTIGTGTVAANTSSLGILRVKQNANWADFGDYGSGYFGIWANQTIPTATNYAWASGSASMEFNHQSQINLNIAGVTKFFQFSAYGYERMPFRIGSTVAPSATLDVTGTMSVSGTSTLTGAVETSTINAQAGQLNLFTAGFQRLQINSAYLKSVPAATTGGAIICFDFPTAAHYSITASTNVPAFKVTGATRGWLTGAISTQYENHFTAPTYTAAGASTITTAAGLYVAKPIMGTNMTATNIYGIATDGAIGSTSKTDGIGYAVGSGSTVTQATSRTTGVTINSVTGSITLVSAAGQTAYQSFTVTNSAVTANDVVIVSQKSGTDLNIVLVTAVAAGSFRISFATTGGTTVEQPVFNFAVIKGQTN